MEKKMIFFFLFTCISQYISSQNTYFKIFETPDIYDFVRDIHRLDEDNLLISGSYSVNEDTVQRGFISKINENGEFIETYTIYNDTTNNYAPIIYNFSNDSIRLFYISNSKCLNYTCLDYNLSFLSEKKIFTDYQNKLFLFCGLYDKNISRFYVPVTVIKNQQTFEFDYSIFKLDIQGNIDTVYEFIKEGFQGAPKIYSYTKDKYILTVTDSGETISLIDKNCNKLTTVKIESDENGYYFNGGNDAFISSNNSIFYTSPLIYNSVSKTIVGVLKYDSLLNRIDETIPKNPLNIDYFMDTYGMSLTKNSSNELFFTGLATPCNDIFCHTYIMVCKMDSNLNIIWEKYYGGDNYFECSAITSTSDNGCMVIGQVRQDSISDIFILKLNSDGNLTNIENSTFKQSELLIYPNPATDFLKIRLGSHLKNVTIEIYDISGKQMLTQKLENIETQINISELISGNYIYKCFDNDRVIETGRFVKE